MKKKYITPEVVVVATENQPLMAGSDKFKDPVKIDPNNPAGETDVTSKHHSLWDTSWEDDSEDDE